MKEAKRLDGFELLATKPSTFLFDVFSWQASAIPMNTRHTQTRTPGSGGRSAIR